MEEKDDMTIKREVLVANLNKAIADNDIPLAEEILKELENL